MNPAGPELAGVEPAAAAPARSYGPTRGARTRRFLAAAALVLVTGCAGGPADSGPDAPDTAEQLPSPLADCAALTAPPGEPSTSTGSPAATEDPLPDLTLPCFTGGTEVALADLAGPAVVNLWAHNCPPCREELPLLQDYAEHHREQVHVLGVVTRDSREPAAALARDAGIAFPALYDREGSLYAAVAAPGLPTTLFVDAEGKVRHVHPGPLDAAALDRLGAEHLRVGRS